MRKILLISAMLLMAGTALADQAVGQTGADGFSVELPNPLGKGTTIQTLIDKAGPVIAGLAGTIAGLMIVVGAFIILTAAGDPTKFEKGKKTILYAVVGLAVVLLSQVIIGVLSELVGSTLK